MITQIDYFGQKINHPECTSAIKANAQGLLDKVNGLLDEARAIGVYKDWIDPDTGTCISGSKGGSGDGGFRLSTSTTGSPGSKHRRARAVDVYDPHNDLDAWISDKVLARHGLYREAPGSTPGWVHLQSVPPKYWKRTFNP